MMAKLQDQLSYPPRAMRAERAAAYLDMSTSTFFRLVEEGLLPKPVKVHGVVSWDRLDLDAAYDNWKSARERVNTVHALLDRWEQQAAPMRTTRPAPTRKIGIYDALDEQNGEAREVKE
jgi:predicted DNA-binding transcriptional regulator AlpA